ncbi:hypothetical protein LTR85_011522 [Meristemomyces frigidus]|nr:hypothetical protein LTR85_011522 [Meristemomyces frigidus]
MSHRQISLPTRPLASQGGAGVGRHHTAPDQAGRDEEFRLPNLRKHVFNQILHRLQNHGIPTEGLTDRLLHWLLPSDRTLSASNESCWTILGNTPLLVSDDQLGLLLKLEPSTASSPYPLAGETIYYIRSFRLSVGELLSLSARLNVQGFRAEFGQPLDSDRVKVYQLPEATARPLTSYGLSQKISVPLSGADVDWREQSIIALLGLDSLLNREVGGRVIRYVRDDTITADFRKLNTKVFYRLRHPQRYVAPSGTGDIDLWMKNIATFAHNNQMFPAGLSFSAHSEAVAARQAYAGRFKGQSMNYHVLAIYGFAPPLMALRLGQAVSVWKQQAKSIDTLMAMLSSLRAIEDGTPSAGLEDVIQQSLLPWVDMQYWPVGRPRTAETALRAELCELSRVYFYASRPLVLISFGEAGVLARNDFKRKPVSSGFPIEESGITTMQSFSDPKGAPRDKDCFLLITCAHTGYLAYEPEDCKRILLRIIDLTLQKLLQTVDVMCHFLERDLEFPTRRELCARVDTVAHQAWMGSPLAKELSDAKVAYAKYKQLQRANGAAIPQRVSGTAISFIKSKYVLKNIDAPESFTLRAVLLWADPQSTTGITRISFHLPTSISPQGDESPRTIYMSREGIDICDGEGRSMPFDFRGRYHSVGNPTISGNMLRQIRIDRWDKSFGQNSWDILELIRLWEYETGLNFDSTYPKHSNTSGIGINLATPSRTEAYSTWQGGSSATFGTPQASSSHAQQMQVSVSRGSMSGSAGPSSGAQRSGAASGSIQLQWLNPITSQPSTGTQRSGAATGGTLRPPGTSRATARPARLSPLAAPFIPGAPGAPGTPSALTLGPIAPAFMPASALHSHGWPQQNVQGQVAYDSGGYGYGGP